MILYVNEKLFSIHRKFYIKDEMDRDVFEISSKAISFGDKTTIRDLNGNEIAYIEQRLLHFTPHYDIFINGEMVCNISKKFQFFKNDYVLSNGYEVKGNVLGLNYNIYNESGNEVANITKKFISIGDKYTMDIKDEKNLNIILSIIVAISNDVNRAQRNSND